MNKIKKLLIVLFLVTLVIPVKTFAYNPLVDDKYYGNYGYDEPDDWSYREDWDDDDYWDDDDSYEIDPDEYDDDVLGYAALGIMLVVMIIVIVINLAISIISAIGFWKIFTKAGKPGYAAIIPIYSEYVKTEIGGTAWWWILIEYGAIIVGAAGSAFTAGLSSIISMASVVARLAINYNICKKFHKDIGYTLLMTFIPFVGAPMLGFSKDAKYDESVVTSEYSLFDSIFNSSNKTTGSTYCPYCGEQNRSSVKFCKNCGNELN